MHGEGQRSFQQLPFWSWFRQDLHCLSSILASRDLTGRALKSRNPDWQKLERQMLRWQKADRRLAHRYDSHREAILRSDTHQAGADAVPTQAADSVNLYAFFSPSCYKGYGDGAKVAPLLQAPPPASLDQDLLCSTPGHCGLMCALRVLDRP